MLHRPYDVNNYAKFVLVPLLLALGMSYAWLDIDIFLVQNPGAAEYALLFCFLCSLPDATNPFCRIAFSELCSGSLIQSCASPPKGHGPSPTVRAFGWVLGINNAKPLTKAGATAKCPMTKANDVNPHAHVFILRPDHLGIPHSGFRRLQLCKKRMCLRPTTSMLGGALVIQSPFDCVKVGFPLNQAEKSTRVPSKTTPLPGGCYLSDTTSDSERFSEPVAQNLGAEA